MQSFSELGAHEVIDYEVEGGVGRAEQADERPQERVQPVVPPGVAQVGHEERGCLKGQGGSETDDEENGSSDQHPGNCHLFTDEVSLPLAAVVVADSWRQRGPPQHGGVKLEGDDDGCDDNDSEKEGRQNSGVYEDVKYVEN